MSDVRLKLGFFCLLPTLITKGCVPMMILGDGEILCVGYGFEQNNWVICQDKIVIGLRINREPLLFVIPVTS